MNPLWLGAPLAAPRGIASSPGGVLYVADPQAGDDRGGRIFAVTAGNPPTLAGSASGFGAHAIEVARDAGDDVIYFTGRDPGDGTPGVFKIRANGADAPAVVWKGAPLVDPDSVAVDHTGVVYVTDRAAGANGLGSVFAINGKSIVRIASGFRPGNPAGLALNRAESQLFVSSLDALQGTAQVLIIDLDTFAAGTANKGIGQNHAAGGLHRAQFADLFAWANSTNDGAVYQVPIHTLK